MRTTPLKWPEGWKRAKSRQAARFDVSFDKAVRELEWEIERLGGKYPNITHNKWHRGKEPEDPGVAVYFEVKGKQRVFACDRWYNVRDNIRAIQKTIEALRGIERWGASEMMDRAFAAFEALPPPSWKVDLGFTYDAVLTWPDVERRHRELAKKYHSDTGNGSDAVMARINAARDAARRALCL